MNGNTDPQRERETREKKVGWRERAYKKACEGNTSETGIRRKKKEAVRSVRPDQR